MLPSELLVLDAESVEDGFNERLLKLMCLNQAVDKMQKEMNIITQTRD